MISRKLTNVQIAWCVGQDIDDGDYVNRGIGFPELIAKIRPESCYIAYHTENGVLGFG